MQDKLSAVKQAKHKDIARGTNKETLAEKSKTQSESTSSEEIYLDDPEDFGIESGTTGGREKEEETDDRYKPDLATVGHNKTQE